MSQFEQLKDKISKEAGISSEEIKVWITGDTHLGSQRVLELSKRPFISVTEMNHRTICNWNTLVHKNDIVIHIGDFGEYEYSKELNGHVVLLLGNYERNDIKTNKVTLDSLKSDYNFSLVLDQSRYYIKVNGKSYNIVHEPSNQKNNRFNLFGHIHKLQMVKRNGLNVGVDCHNFYPIDFDTVEFYKQSIKKHYDEEVFGY
ncbi:hypothetical protein CEW46_29780 [Bacillus cereus]|nr:hypothetical protein CEW46_29780 [Bacillus cereus]